MKKKIWIVIALFLVICVSAVVTWVIISNQKCQHIASEWMTETDATCTQEGSKYKECTLCHTILEEETIDKKDHNYVVESIITEATCYSAGTKKLTCDTCSAYTTESYELEKLSATEINEQALQYVGEITTYDKQGYALGLGTGFVYSSDGKVITNYHVIDGAYSAEIIINGTTYAIQKVLAYDETIDLAVLKINAHNIPCATICTKEIPVGSTVYAIGSSRGLTNTFSRGMVTYYNRIVDGVSHVQHDASITNGNSGGPLINEYGEVVGINTWLLRDSQNLNFAVFTAEINNLEFGTPITLAELYESNTDAYDTLLNWLFENYNHQNANIIAYKEWQDDLLYEVAYDSNYDYMCICISMTDATIILDLSHDPSEYYYYFQYDGDYDYYTVSGEINAYIYTTDTPLRNYDFSGAVYADDEYAVHMAHLSVDLSVLYLENMLLLNPEIGLTIEDFGFVMFE